MKRIYETFWCAWIYETMFEFIGGWEVFYREMMMKWEPPRKALIFEFASFKHERSTTRHSDWSGIACKLQRCQWKLLQKLLFLMPSMMKITSSSSGFQFFFWGTMPPNCAALRWGKVSGHSHLLRHYTPTIQCLWKTLFKALTNASLEKYIEDTYSVVKLESPLNVWLLTWEMLLKVSTLKTGKKSKCLWVTQLRKYIVKEWWGTREFVYLKKQINFWNRLKFPNKIQYS